MLSSKISQNSFVVQAKQNAMGVSSSSISLGSGRSRVRTGAQVMLQASNGNPNRAHSFKVFLVFKSRSESYTELMFTVDNHADYK